MLYIYISPAKALKEESEVIFETSKPIYQEEANNLASTIKTFSLSYLKKVMGINEVLAQKVYDYYQDFNHNIAPALFKYNGLVYKQISPNTLNDEELDYLKKHLLIGSGLYGILKAFDGISSYRLELNKRIKELGDLTTFYQHKISEYFNEDDIIINLASDEYSKLLNNVKAKIIKINFVKQNNERCSMLQTHGKIYRGRMVRFLATNFIENCHDILRFQDKNLKLYSYDEHEITFMEV